MRLPSWLRSRVDRSALALGLAVGDAVAIGGFVVVGEVHHGHAPLANAGHVAETMAIFFMGWAVAAVLGSLFTADAVKNFRRVFSWTVPAWVTATLLIHLTRLVSSHGGTDWTFAAVTLVIGGVMVVGWRVIAALVVRWLSSGGAG